MRRNIRLALVGSVAAPLAALAALATAGTASADPYDDWSYKMIDCMGAKGVKAGPYTPADGWIEVYDHTPENIAVSLKCQEEIGAPPRLN